MRKTPMTGPGLSQAERAHLHNLIRVLLPHPEGLRRWSVMRAIRSLHEKAALEIPLKLEDEVERVFRRHGGDSSGPVESDSRRELDPETRLFCRPTGRPGEIWAVHPDEARAWLTTADTRGEKAVV